MSLGVSMEDWGAVCEHDISEREVATVADGLCPICLAASCAALRQRVEEYHEEALAAVTAEADALARKREIATERDALRQRVEELEAELDRPKHETLRQLADAVERYGLMKKRVEGAEKRVEELEREAALNRQAAEKHYAYGEAQRELAEAAEAKLAQCVEVLADFTWDGTGAPTCWPNRDRVDAALAAAKARVWRI